MQVRAMSAMISLQIESQGLWLSPNRMQVVIYLFIYASTIQVGKLCFGSDSSCLKLETVTHTPLLLTSWNCK